MEIDASAAIEETSEHPPEKVGSCADQVYKMGILVLIFSYFQSPWVAELEALFEQCKQIVPSNAIELIG